MRVEPSADVADGAAIGDGSSVWHLAQVREGAVLGGNCIVGRGAYVGTGVRMGDNCKLQNYALVYEPAVLEDGVFVGPAVVFTNDHYPRAVDPDGNAQARRRLGGRRASPCRQGASIGARAVCVAPVTIGRWALVAAGSVVDQGRPRLRPGRRRPGPAAPAGSARPAFPSSRTRPARGSARRPASSTSKNGRSP